MHLFAISRTSKLVTQKLHSQVNKLEHFVIQYAVLYPGELRPTPRRPQRKDAALFKIWHPRKPFHLLS